MKIQSSNTSFNGTRLKYQKLDQIMRNSNSLFPRISPYRVNMRVNQRCIPQHFFGWIQKIGDIVDENRKKVSSKDFINIIKNDLENVKNSKLGDCGESSSIAIASLIANGFKNFKIGLLLFDAEFKQKNNDENIIKRTYNTTHEMVVLNLDEDAKSENTKTYGKNVIILDPWICYCGNLQKAFERFYEVFMNGTRKIENSNGYECKYRPRLEFYDPKIETTDNIIKDFRDNYPELIINNK